MKQMLLTILMILGMTPTSFSNDKKMEKLRITQLNRDFIKRKALYNKIKNDKSFDKYFKENPNQKIYLNMIYNAIKCEDN